MFLFKSPQHKELYYHCSQPELTICAKTTEEVLPALRQIEELQKKGYMLAGWISYEAAVAFDPRHKASSDGSFPLIYMMASTDVKLVNLDSLSISDKHDTCQALHPHITQEEYERSCSRVLEYIKNGDIYQANYSFRCDVELPSPPLSLFKFLEQEHPVPYSCFIDNGEWQILSQSPELFLHREGNKITSKPMKGTIQRGLNYAEDEAQRIALSQDKKSQAENVMIVDLMRNDLSRICQLQSVKVPELFTATRYGSLHQLTSTVEGILKPDCSLEQILTATFPAGSITGAPKIRAMEIIEELETEGRKIYTGSAGLFFPGGDFLLNVCIRTLACRHNKALLGIGSGVVADSAQTLEWEECLLKSSFINFEHKHKYLFETMLWEDSYSLKKEHLERLQNSCDYFQIPFDRQQAEKHLQQIELTEAHRVKLMVDKKGLISSEVTALSQRGWGKKELKVKISSTRTNSENIYLYHKTDNRDLYNREYKEAITEGYDEVIYLNEQEFVCEGAISNLFCQIGGQWLTPALTCGLLPGTWRQKMIRELNAEESLLTIKHLQKAENIILGNSIRQGAAVKLLQT